MPRHWDRRQRHQEKTGSRKWNVPVHSIRRCTCRKNKWGDLYESSVWGTPRERRPQQDMNCHRWKHNHLPRGCSNPHTFPWPYQYHYKQCPFLPWVEVFLLWREKKLSCHPDGQTRIFQNQDYWYPDWIYWWIKPTNRQSKRMGIFWNCQRLLWPTPEW